MLKPLCEAISEPQYDPAWSLANTSSSDSLEKADSPQIPDSIRPSSLPGALIPGMGALELSASDSHAQRREPGTLNFGGPGIAHVEGMSLRLAPRDAIHFGCISQGIRFGSKNERRPETFCFVSYPARANHDPKAVSVIDSESLSATTPDANCRRFRQRFCLNGLSRHPAWRRHSSTHAEINVFLHLDNDSP
jgi:hypothetical protein